MRRLDVDDVAEPQRAGSDDDADERETECELVAHHLGAGAQSTEQRVFVVRRPAGERDAINADGGDAENDQQADIEIGNLKHVDALELDICAEGKTPDLAVRGLKNAMIGYLHVMLDGQGTNAVASLKRPSPLSHRIRYFVERLKCEALRPFLRSDESRVKKFYDFSPSPRLIRSHCGI